MLTAVLPLFSPSLVYVDKLEICKKYHYEREGERKARKKNYDYYYSHHYHHPHNFLKEDVLLFYYIFLEMRKLYISAHVCIVRMYMYGGIFLKVEQQPKHISFHRVIRNWHRTFI